MATKMRKHKIGKRERASLETELAALSLELYRLGEKNENGFAPFYDDVETNSKKVQRRFWLEEVLGRGSYHKEVTA